jgi:O-antigen ligase
LALAALALLGFQSTAWIFVIVGLASAYIVDSRYSMIAIVFVTAVSSLKYARKINRTNRGYVLAAFIAIMTVFVVSGGTGFVSDALQVNSDERGIGSGFTGRDDLNIAAIPQIFYSPFIGYGFRQRANYMAAHNGYLNTWLENGVFIGSALIINYVMKFLTGSFRILRTSKRQPDEAIVCAGILGACLFSSYFQGQLVNFGDPLAFVTMMSLTYHPQQRHRI